MSVPHGPRRTLVVTNDFPPRRGGIQSFVHELTRRQPAGSVVVYASDHPGSAAFDAAQPFPVLRHPGSILLPTPGVRRRAVEALREYGCRSVWFGAAAPLGLLAPALRRAGAERIVATTHGHEAGWAMLPGARSALRRVGCGCDTVTYLGDYFRTRLAPAFGPHSDVVQLRPGVEVETFSPEVDGSAVRRGYALDGAPVIVCVSRLVRRKGQDTLIDALPAVRAAVPGTQLLLVGEGPYRDDLVARARQVGVSRAVVFTGPVAQTDLPAHYAAGDVFAMPCRTRRAGMDVEGLGIVYLEASASGLPVLAGDSGGAPDAVLDGRTGVVVDGTDPRQVATQLIALLEDAQRRRAMGAAGRDWVCERWQWDRSAATLTDLLQS